MGKLKGFLEIRRREPAYRPVKERVKDFNEVEKRLSDDEIREQAARCMDCGIPFCHGCGCPLSNLIPEWNDLVYHGRWRDAVDVLYVANNFPEFTGRICPALCEASCTVGFGGDAVAIREIEISIIEKAYSEGYIKPYPPKTRTGCKVVVVGSGPAGLALADDLNHMGHLVTVFEQDNKIGGLLRYGIPDFKLEKKIIDRRINLMEQECVRFETGGKIGLDVSMKYLLTRFDAVCITCGAREPRDLMVPGRELGGIYFAMDFLALQNKKVSAEPFSAPDIVVKDKKVVIIGGGDTGSDCVGTSIRQGAASVTQIEIMPEPPEKRDLSTPWPMWPYMLRTSSSHREGGTRMWGIMTKAFEGEKDRVKQIRAIKVEWEKDFSGRPAKMREIKDSEFVIPADIIFISMGFAGIVNNELISELKIKVTDNRTIAVDKNMMTSVKGVFAAGDAVSGASLVVRAIASGKELAKLVNNFLSSQCGKRKKLRNEPFQTTN